MLVVAVVAESNGDLRECRGIDYNRKLQKGKDKYIK